MASLPTGAAAFFDAVKAWIPSGTTITIPNGGDLIDEATGTLIGTWGTSGATTVNTSAAGAFAGGVGGRIVWRTSVIRGGYRVRGSTFVAPLMATAYDAQGTLTGTALTALTSAANALLTNVGGELRVWSRPRPGLSGAQVPVDAADIPDKVSWLRSRRT